VTEKMAESLISSHSRTLAAKVGLAQSAGARIATQGLLDQFDQVRSAQDRLVGLWASFKAERLALYRDLGVLPFDDWKSFYNDLEARRPPGAE
jgi:hypothetical protein